MLMQAGSATALHWAINSVKKGGIVSIVGVYGPTGNLVPIGNVVNKGITIRGNQASVKRLLPKMIEHVKNGNIQSFRESRKPRITKGRNGMKERKPKSIFVVRENGFVKRHKNKKCTQQFYSECDKQDLQDRLKDFIHFTFLNYGLKKKFVFI